MVGGYPSSPRANRPPRRVQTGAMSDQEVPEPDAVEQALPVAEDDPRVLEPSREPEVPEADALEQAIAEPVDEDEGLR
jgi:hypothetical protein